MFLQVITRFFRKIRVGDIHIILNITGLSIGIATCLLIYLYIADEVSYDRHHVNAQNVFRLLQHSPRTGNQNAIQPGVLYDHIHDLIPGVEHIARIYPIRESTVSVDGQPFTENGFAAVDQSLFQILSFRFIAGDPATALSEPNNIVLTRSAAQKYFGKEDPMGKSLLFYNAYTYIVAGVIEDFPSQSHLDFSVLASMESMVYFNPSALSSWDNASQYFYLRLMPDVNPDNVSAQITNHVWSAYETFKDRVEFRLQPLLDIRLHSAKVGWDNALKSDMYIVIIFSAVAVLILFLACFNFVNMSTAVASRRSMEVGVRKVVGADRGLLMRQFLLEAFLFSFISLLLALLLAEVLLPALNFMSGKQLSIPLFSSFEFALILAGFLIVIPLLSGIYPAFIMSRFEAITAIKGGNMITSVKAMTRNRVQLRTRQLLLLLQFAVSITLIVASMSIYRQMAFLSGQKPGFDPAGLIVVRNQWDAQAPHRAIWLREQLLQHPDVEMVSLAHNVPSTVPNNYTNYQYESREGSQRVHGAIISCDEHYIQTLRGRLLEGRDFKPDMVTDASNATIINQAMANRLDVENVIGATLSGFFDGKPRQVIGIVDDIHFSSMHNAVTPMAFFISHDSYPQNWLNMLVRCKPEKASLVAEHIDRLWKEEAPQWPLQYFHVDQRFSQLYQADRRVMYIVFSFAGLAILLSVLGLTGLAYFAANTRIREIGIRKVMGASISQVVRLMSGESGIIALVANLVALPLSWHFVNRWLDNFAYRVTLNWVNFVVPAVFVFLVVWIVVGLISYKAASVNPANTLRANG